MVSAGVSFNGKTRLHFIDTNTTKVNSHVYIDLLENKLLPDCRNLHHGDDFVFMQDGATSHTSYLTQTFLETQNVNFIKKHEWPLMSPDLNPMDYGILPALRELVYFQRTTPFTEEELKEKISESWNQIPITLIQNSVSAWKKRLRAVIKANGKSTEHLWM